MATLDTLSKAEILALVGPETADDLTAELTARAAGVTLFGSTTAPRLLASIAEVQAMVQRYGPPESRRQFRAAYGDVVLGLRATLGIIALDDPTVQRYGDLKRLLNTATGADPGRFATVIAAITP